MNARHRARPARSVPAPSAALVALLVGALTPVAAAAAPAWLLAVRDAAFARARAPLEGAVLDAALRERRRAAAGALPSLHLRERSRLGFDGAYALTLEAGVTLPVLAPTVSADAKVTALRLAITERQLAAERRAEAHDVLVQAAALLAARARVRALDALAHALDAPTPPPGALRAAAGGSERALLGGAAATARTATERLRARVDARLLLAGRATQVREARRLRAEIARSLALPLPGGGLPPAPPRSDAAPLFGALGFAASDLRPRRCLIASDAVALARLSVAEQRASRRLREARADPHVDLELGGAAALGSAEPAASYTARVGISVRLPPWSPAAGAASLSAGAQGLEQEATLSWPNRAPGPPPQPAPSPDPVAEAERAVGDQLARLQGQERDLARRRAVLLAGLASVGGRTHDSAYLRASLALQLADAEQALDLTALDAALLCDALPP